MAVYPAIRAVPDYTKKKQYRHDMVKVVGNNDDAIFVRKMGERQKEEQERAVFNREAERGLKEQRQNERLAKQQLLRKNLEIQKTQVQQMAQNKFQNKMRQTARQLEHTIVFQPVKQQLKRMPQSVFAARKNHGVKDVAHALNEVERKIKAMQQVQRQSPELVLADSNEIQGNNYQKFAKSKLLKKDDARDAKRQRVENNDAYDY